MKAHRYVPNLGPHGTVSHGWNMLNNTAPFDMTGHPAITIPCAKSEGPAGRPGCWSADISKTPPCSRPLTLSSSTWTGRHYSRWPFSVRGFFRSPSTIRALDAFGKGCADDGEAAPSESWGGLETANVAAIGALKRTPHRQGRPPGFLKYRLLGLFQPHLSDCGPSRRIVPHLPPETC